MGEQRYMLSGRGWVHSLRIDGDELGYFLGVCVCVCVCVCVDVFRLWMGVSRYFFWDESGIF